MNTITPLPKHMTAEDVQEVRAAIQLANVRHEANRVWPIIAECKPSLRVGLQEIARGIDERDHAAVKQRVNSLMTAVGWMVWEIDDHDMSVINADVVTFDAARVAEVIAMFGEGQEKTE